MLICLAESETLIKELILVGGGGHCKSCIDVIEKEAKFQVAGIVDTKTKIGQNVLGYPIIGSDEDLEAISNHYCFFLITLGQLESPEKRIRLYNYVTSIGGTFPTIVSPFAYISKYATIKDGTIIMHFALVNANAIIGENCIVNTKALIEHDAIIGNHCHISTNAIINGGVKIGCCSFIGSAAVCRQEIEISNYSFIKANSVVK